MTDTRRPRSFPLLGFARNRLNPGPLAPGSRPMTRTLLRTAAAAVMAAAALGAHAEEAQKYDVDILDPAEEVTVFSDSGDLLVRATVAPALAKGDRVELLVDGEPGAPPGAALEFPLSGIPRGLHVLQARIIDSTGNVRAVSPSRTFSVWQASLLFPNRFLSGR